MAHNQKAGCPRARLFPPTTHVQYTIGNETGWPQLKVLLGKEEWETLTISRSHRARLARVPASCGTKCLRPCYWEIVLYSFFSVDPGSAFWEVLISLLFSRATREEATGEDVFYGGESSDVRACFLLSSAG